MGSEAMQALEDLTYASRRAFLSTHPLPKLLRCAPSHCVVINPET